MAVRSMGRIPVYVYIPPKSFPVYRIEIYTQSGDTYDITNRVLNGEYTDGITETIGNFNFTINNVDQAYLGKWNLYDQVRIYMDYASSATTLRFIGLIEKLSKQGIWINLRGRSSALKTMGTTITKSYTNYTHDIIQDLISSYFSEITGTNIDTSESTDTIVTVSWYQKPFWECIQELCFRAGYDAYIDSTFDFHYFVSGILNNDTEAVVHTSNLLQVSDFTPDLSVVKNRVIVYGAKVEDMQIIWTAEDSSSISSYGVKEEIISDSNIRTRSQAQARAEYELSLKKDPPIVGEVISLLLPTIAPGEKIKLSSPLSGLDPGYYAIQKFTHQFPNEGIAKTTLTIEKETSTIPKILKKRIAFETESTEKENPYEMRYSWLFTFDTDNGTHSGTQIIDGILKLSTGESNGSWESELLELDNPFTVIEARVSGDNLVGVEVWASADGNPYTKIAGPGERAKVILSGIDLKIRLNLNSPYTQIKAASILYK